jgi:hypothetical protein
VPRRYKIKIPPNWGGPDEPRPVPQLEHREREDLERRRRGYLNHAADMPPPPWVLADEPEADEEGSLASFVALAPARASRTGDVEWWLVRGVLRRSDEGPPGLARVAVEHFDDPNAEVTPTTMRDLNFGTIREQACHALAFAEVIHDVHLKGRGGWTRHDDAWVRKVAEEAKRPLRRGRKGYPNEHYRWIAVRYLEIVGTGRRDVLKALATEEEARLGRPVPRETVRDWVRKATELGYLAPGKRGRASARPGPNLNLRR